MSEEVMKQQEEFFLSLGLEPQKARDSPKNQELSLRIIEVAKAAGAEKGCDKAVGKLIYHLASKYPKDSPVEHMTTLAGLIGTGEINSIKQVDAGIKYSSEAGASDLDNLKTACGIGVVVSPEQVKASVAELIEKNKDGLTKQRYKFPVGKLYSAAKSCSAIEWAKWEEIQSEVDQQVRDFLGEKTEADLAAEQTKKGKKTEKKAPQKKAEKVALTRPAHDYQYIFLKNLSSDFVEKRVELRGWIHHRRREFFELRDGTGFVQCLLTGASKKALGVEELRRETCLIVCGVVKQPPAGHFAKWSGLEIAVEYWEVIGHSPVELEEELNQESDVHTLFDKRHIVLRSERPANYLKLRSMIEHFMRCHYFDRGYSFLSPPTIVQTQAEGGSELFKLQYYEQEAYLTQSSQLYLETACPALGKVYCMTSSYRAEQSSTRRHLSEYIHLEAELPFITFDDLLDAIEDLVCDTLERVTAHPEAAALLKQINPDFVVPKRPFRRLNYLDAIQMLIDHKIAREDGSYYKVGEDIKEREERLLVDTVIKEPVFLCRFPIHLKAFYMPKCKDDPTLSDSTDLLVPGVGEIVGASMRIDNYEELMAAYKREGIDPAPYYWFTDQRKYGTFPHGGYGLGVERFMTWVFGDQHIRNVCFYPRYFGRCSP